MNNLLLKSLTTVLLALFSLCANAQVEIDGIYYYLNDEAKTAKVDSRPWYEEPYSGEVVIPESVEYEGDAYSVTSIGYDAFWGCSDLTSVTIPEGVTSIGYRAFADCSNLSSVTIPEGVTSIGDYAFQDCSGLTSVSIPEGVTSIGYRAFSGCSALTSVIILCPQVGDWFEGYTSIKELTLGEKVTSIGDGAFSGCSGLSSVTIPEGVTSIGYRAFYGCSGLTSVTIPSSVTSIDYVAFYGCNGLTSVIILCPQVGDWFESNTSIKELTLGEKVTSIGDGAFSGCSGLSSVTIPEGVTSIGYRAFADCSNLSSVTIPNSVTIGDDAFYGCSGLTEPIYSLTSFAYMPSSYEGSYAIPEGITSISGSAFAGCSGLTSIAIPNSVTTIGDGAFAGCSGLTSVTIPNSVTSISPSAFLFCSGLVTIVVDESNVIYDSRENCNAIIETASNRLVIGCSNTIIPNSITSIAYSAFSGCSGLNNITIPNSVTSIGMGAFGGCSGLTNVIIPEGITKISPFVFEGCNNLVSVTIPNSVTSIGQGAFSGCCALTSVIIPNSVTNIDGGAFAGCENLASIEIPNSVVNIGSDAFKNTAWYDNQEDGLVYAGNVAYEYKGEMPENTSVTIKDGTVTIAYGAFMNCSGLTTVTIPSSVTSIGSKIFEGCTGLTDVYCYAESVPEIDDYYGFGHHGSAYLHVPSSSIAEYKKAWGWEFSIIGGFVYELVDLIENGDLEEESPFPYFYSKEMSVDDGALLKSRVVDGEGKDGTKGIVVHSSDWVSSYWDNQFYIILPFAIPIGTPIFVEFDYKASNSGTVQTSGHEVIGVGVSSGIGRVEMGTEWNHFKFASAVTSYTTANDIKCIAFDLNYIRQATDFYFDNISFKLFKEDWEVLSNTGVEIDPMEKKTEITFDESITEETDLTNLVVENVYVTLDKKADGYDAGEECIVLTSTMTEEQVEGISDKEVGEAIVKENFNGLILEVPAGTGTVSIDAQTKGSRSLNVKVGDGEAQTFVQPERGKVEIPYTVTDDSYVYIYGAATSASAQRRAISSDTENGVLIYGVKWEGVSTDINSVVADGGTYQIYTVDGKQVDALQQGVNIIRYSNGTSQKVYVK